MPDQNTVEGEIQSVNEQDAPINNDKPTSPTARTGYGENCCDGFVGCPMYSGDPGCASKKR